MVIFKAEKEESKTRPKRHPIVKKQLSEKISKSPRKLTRKRTREKLDTVSNHSEKDKGPTMRTRTKNRQNKVSQLFTNIP